MNQTKIEWTDYTSNPVGFQDAEGGFAWGCVKVSAGCANCYAESLAKRYNRGYPYTVGSMARKRVVLDEVELQRILSSKAIAGHRVFLGDMTDVFGEWVPDAMLDRVFAAMALRPDVTFQVLTKRPERMRSYLTLADAAYDVDCAVERVCDERDWCSPTPLPWPLPNVWLGVSVEDQAAADRRIPELLATPAAVRFLSCEPLLGPVDLGPWAPDLDWVIMGGESGPGSRPCDLGWIRGVMAQCRAAGVPCFVKQLGVRPIFHPAEPGNPGLVPPRRVGAYVQETPLRWALKLRNRKGGDMSEWPEDLRRREFPEVPA